MVLMDFGQHVVSAGRTVLEEMEREWQPLSAGELELRMDHEVEKILESELMGRLETQPSTAADPQSLRSKPSSGAQGSPSAAGCTSPDEKEAEATVKQGEKADSEAVKYISELLQSSNSGARLAGRARLSLSQTVLLSLSLLSERVSYRSVSRRFQLEKGNIHRIFFSFCERISNLQEKLIKWPLGEEAGEALFPFSSLVVNKPDEGNGVPQVLGILGHTRIPTRLCVGKKGTDKKEAQTDCWLNLELVCGWDGQFLHCRVSKGSDVDGGRKLRDRLKQNPPLMPAGSFLVARTGFPLGAQILTPYTGGHGQKQELFNRTLEECFRILDRAVGSLKTRFKRLAYLDIGNYHRARAVVLTACVLHNAFLKMGNELQGESESEDVVMAEPEEDEEGRWRRDAVADLLMWSVESGNA